MCISQVSDNGGNVSFLYDLVGSGSQVSSLSRGVAADETDGGSRQSGTQGVDYEVVDQQLFSSRGSANKEATATVVTLTDHHQRPRYVGRQRFEGSVKFSLTDGDISFCSLGMAGNCKQNSIDILFFHNCLTSWNWRAFSCPVQGV